MLVRASALALLAAILSGGEAGAQAAAPAPQPGRGSVPAFRLDQDTPARGGAPAAARPGQPAAPGFRLDEAGPARGEAPAQLRRPPTAGVGFRPERPQVTPRPVPAAANAPAAAPVDESALRFYASRGEVARVAAEIRRLRAENPGWQPPADLMTEASERIDEQPLWELYREGRLEEVREQIALIQAAHPSYRPSADLASKLLEAEQRAVLVQASEARQWEQVVEIATETPDLLVCREMDVMWRVADALVQLQDLGRATELYRYILRHCDNPRERLATVQKASQALDAPTVEQLIAMGRRRSDGTSEFEAVRLDLTRRAVGTATSGASAEQPSERQLRALETSARTRRNADDASLLGWFHYSRRDYAQARDWFALSMEIGVRPKAVEGLVLSLRNLGELRRAEDLAFEHRALDPLIRRAFIEIVAFQMTGTARVVLDPPRLARVQEVVLGEQSALGAQSVGWYLYNRNDIRGARTWFERSVAWSPTEEGVVGLGVAAHRLGDRRTFASVIATHRGRFPAVEALTRMDGRTPRGGGPRTAAQVRAGRAAEAAARRAAAAGAAEREEIRSAVALFEARQYREAALALERRAQRGGERHEMGTLRGWAHLNAGDYNRAREVFAELDRRRSTRDTRHGQWVAETRLLGNDMRYFPWEY